MALVGSASSPCVTDRQWCRGDIVLVNDQAGPPGQHALLMEFDSVHGRWPRAISSDGECLTLAGQRIVLISAKRSEDRPLAAMGIDLVIDATGVFRTVTKIALYFVAGVKMVVVSAPVKDGGALNLVYGVNRHLYDSTQHHIVTAASCTTNCLAPIVKVMHESLGIHHC
jgi:glyceraldehyde 3-phosphate dehydrogenase